MVPSSLTVSTEWSRKMNLKINPWQKLKLLATFVFGDMATVFMWAVDWFNVSVLGKIKDPKEANLYCKDVKDFSFFLRSVLTRHPAWMTDEKRRAFIAVIDSVDCLAAALEDLKVTREELSELAGFVREAIRAWKEA